MDPNSDELYEELRRKLADYGSQPSEEVWAAIRQRVPAAPTPALQVRRRVRRRTVAASLLFLLLSGVLVARYYYQVKWFTQDLSPTAQGPMATTTRGSKVPRPSAALPGGAAPVATTPPADRAIALNVQRNGSPQREASSAALQNSSQTNPEPHSDLRASQDLGTAQPTRRALDATAPGVALAKSKQKQAARAASGKQTSSSETAAQLRSSVADASQTPALERSGEAARTTSSAPLLPDRTANAQVGASESELALLQSLAVSLALPAVQTPLVMPVPSPPTLPPPPAPVGSRLAVQLLAGPALSYRYLGRPGSDTLTNAVEKLERPAESYSAELGVTYTLTPRLTLLTGLGYTEYATRLDLTVKQPVVVYASFQRPVFQYTNGSFNTLYVPDSVASGDTEAEQHVRHRDVYRFVSVPVQVQYQLGTAGRFGYGLLLGASANLYLGGRTTQASGCGCEQDNWHSSGSPFRLVSVGLTAGTTISYRLAERWRLNLQPTFNYLLTPLAQDQTRSARHLLSAGMRTGVSFDLR
ncbi:hypothetical protein BXP70_19810 [Hymenobacter crusticola]|uniref:Outer membrane protein beta-barrel domain-containing protein n=2 Tax=Hymenobacter crusticola TaxID=1770526 RepID=A0A243W9X2_9BACT|nr:hypothetical protein BXP70_19810 [Hymenobacter crusticola]